MKTRYLAPDVIVAFGFDNARNQEGQLVKRSLVTRLLAGLFGKSVSYINAWGRDSDREARGTGEENPIHWFERLLEFFFLHCREAAILMVARVQFRYEQLMNQTSQQPFNAAEARHRALELNMLLHVAIETGDDNEITQAGAAFVRFGQDVIASLNAQNVAPAVVAKPARRYVPTAFPVR